MRRFIFFIGLLALLLSSAAALAPVDTHFLYLPLVARPAVSPVIGGCPVFPADNAWNQDISSLPLDPLSDAYLNRISDPDQDGLANYTQLHPDFGSYIYYGIPYVVVPAGQPLVPLTIDPNTGYPDESDPGPYPLPAEAPVEGEPGNNGDRHVLVVRQGECKLYELYRAFKDASGSGWTADSSAVFDLRSNALRPAGWTSADAAGLPILPGLVRYDEVAAGLIRHAVRFTVQRSQRAYLAPARHWASSSSDPNYPPMGLRLRLKANYDLTPVTGQALVILTALKKYGMIVADNGSSWFISGASDARWNDTDLNQLKLVPASAFEVVQTGAIQK